MKKVLEKTYVLVFNRSESTYRNIKSLMHLASMAACV
jgi:hypothetical protein